MAALHYHGLQSAMPSAVSPVHVSSAIRSINTLLDSSPCWKYSSSSTQVPSSSSTTLTMSPESTPNFLFATCNINNHIDYHQHLIHTHTHTRLTALCPELPGWAGIIKVKTIWILLKQETVSGSGISWATCKSAPPSRQITTPAPHHSVFTGRMPFLLPNQQHQSTEGKGQSI